MQGDNELVVYNSAWSSIWSSGTWTGNIGNAYFMKMRDDGNLVMYKSNGTTIVWQTNTTSNISFNFETFFAYRVPCGLSVKPEPAPTSEVPVHTGTLINCSGRCRISNTVTDH